MEHNMVKKPNWKELNQLAIFTSVVKDLKSGLTENESSEQSEKDMNSGPPDYKLVLRHISLKIYYDYINTLQKVTNCASYKIVKN